MRLLKWLTHVFCAVAFSLAASAQVYPLANSGFESPVLSPTSSWFNGVQGWGTVGAIGTTYSSSQVPGHPAPEGNQFVWASGEGWHLFQQTGTLRATTRYWFSIDVFPLASGTNRMEISIEETDTWSAVLASAWFQPSWAPERRDFALPPGQWTTITIGFNSIQWPAQVGRNFRVRVAGANLALDKARLLVDPEIHTFYFSSTGNDTNTGFAESSAWKSFGKLAPWFPLSPGERVLLRRGDTFNEELTIRGKGTAASPIEITGYGTGPKPILVRSNLAQDVCVKWEGASYARISQLDCRNAKLGIYLRYHSEPGKLDVNNRDVQIDSCDFRDMPDATLEPADHNYEFAFSDAIFVGGHDWVSDQTTGTYYTFLDGLRITRCVATNTAHGFGAGWYYPAPYYSRLRNLVMEDNVALNCLDGWASITSVDGGHMKRCHSIGGGGKDTWAGTTLGMIQNSRNYLIEDCVFAYCDRAQAGDGSGMDFEGDTVNVTFNRNIIHDNDASALLILSTGGHHQNLVITSNVFYNNARDPWNSEINSEIQGSVAPHTGIISQNGLYRRSADIHYLSPGSTWTGFAVSGNRQNTYTPTPGGWNFNQDGNLEGWQGFNHIPNAAVSVGKLQGTSAGVDPFVHSPAVFINPYLTPYVWIRMRHNTGTVAQIFFITEADRTWDQSKSVFFNTNPDGEFHDYFVNLASAGAATVITQLRLDPAITENCSFEIDFVRITDSSSPLQIPPGPLPPVPVEVTFTSIATEDGHTVESAQNSGAGGARDSTGTTFRVGDDAANRAYRTILSFNTASLPDTAVVTEATLGITRVGSISGVIPIGVPNKTFGDIPVDVITGAFGGNAALENLDWQAPATRAAISKFAYPAYSDLMTIYSRLETPDLSTVNRMGMTQFRIRYEYDDDNDGVADFVSYATANDSTVSRRPTLRIRYVTNYPPVLVSPFLAEATSGKNFAGQLAATDPDASSTLIFSRVSGPGWLNVSPSGVLSGFPAITNTGQNSFTVRVTDNAGASDYGTVEITVINPDQNGNGMLDTWEIARFGNATAGSNPPNGDPDQDGIRNVLEYAFDTNPLQSNASPVQVELMRVGEDSYLSLAAPRNPAAENLVYLVQVADSIDQPVWGSESLVIVQDTPERLVIRDNRSHAQAGKRFLRLLVQVRTN